jgi:hypothetical protein
MKTTFNTFDFQNDDGVTELVIIHAPNLRGFLEQYGHASIDFIPDFIDKKLYKFIFCRTGTNWKRFTESVGLYTGAEFQYRNLGPNPSFTLDDYVMCNPAIIKYLRMETGQDTHFLFESLRRDMAERFIADIHNALLNPHESGITSLESFINFFNNENYLTKHDWKIKALQL